MNYKLTKVVKGNKRNLTKTIICSSLMDNFIEVVSGHALETAKSSCYYFNDLHFVAD